MGCLRKCTLAGQTPKATWGVHHLPQTILQASWSRPTLANWVKVYPGSGTILKGQERSGRADVTVKQKKPFSLHQVWLCQGSVNGSESSQREWKKNKNLGKNWEQNNKCFLLSWMIFWQKDDGRAEKCLVPLCRVSRAHVDMSCQCGKQNALCRVRQPGLAGKRLRCNVIYVMSFGWRRFNKQRWRLRQCLLAVSEAIFFLFMFDVFRIASG